MAGYSVIHYYTPGEDIGGDLRFTHGGRGGRARGPQGLPLFKPPYSRMTAIDLNTGEHVWVSPTGNGDAIRNHELLKDLNLPPLGGDGRGGPLLTKTLLISPESPRGGTPVLVARDKTTGTLVGSVSLPSRVLGTPMTYRHEGKQYIAFTVTGSPPELIALSLP